MYQPLSFERRTKDEKTDNDFEVSNKVGDYNAGSVELDPMEQVSQETDNNEQRTNVTAKAINYGRVIRNPSRYWEGMAAININYFHPLSQDDDDDDDDDDENDTFVEAAMIGAGIDE